MLRKSLYNQLFRSKYEFLECIFFWKLDCSGFTAVVVLFIKYNLNPTRKFDFLAASVVSKQHSWNRKEFYRMICFQVCIRRLVFDSRNYNGKETTGKVIKVVGDKKKHWLADIIKTSTKNITQVKDPDGKSICLDPDERPTGPEPG